ncbi:cytochrome c biogenesis protein ResB [Nocardioides sp. ChNu-99]|uniref:cytochrome c biogenesis protein ResB n=1 Tax=Nocardioides sp. ChNu-99 TaxID=2839897 RepID=UPI0024072DAD|nr:cytochrome c biogenesis protein ResB [Nocardioides sp. ChNu-99]
MSTERTGRTGPADRPDWPATEGDGTGDAAAEGPATDPGAAPVEGPGSGVPGRRPGELTFRETLRWGWRQLTSMRTALVLLLLVALAAIPGSIVPQEDVDSFAVGQWQEDHPRLTPIYERLGLFSVYDSPWFAAIYLLLMISLVGCILPRLRVYARAVRAKPPRAPRNLTRLPDHTSYRTQESPAEAAAAVAAVLRKRRYRVVEEPEPDAAGDVVVRAERGYLREAGNLVFHLSVLVVLAGFAMGSLLGYQGGVITLVGNGFANNVTQYDDLDSGSLWSPDDLEPFAYTIEDFDIDWYRSGPAFGQARAFSAQLSYTEDVTEGTPEKTYDLRVNHPLTIGDTDLFLIGHGYAPVITVRDAEGEVAYSGPTIFLPTDLTFASFGVVKVPDGLDTQVGLEGEFYPYYGFDMETGPYSVFGEASNPRMSLIMYTGDLGMDSGAPQSVYALQRDGLEPELDADGVPVRFDLAVGDVAELPDGLGTVEFEGLERWNRIQISQTPGKLVALGGVVAALVGLLGSLFIRPRRVWVRVRPAPVGGWGDVGGDEDDQDAEGGPTLVVVGVLDRSTGAGGGDEELQGILEDVRGPRVRAERSEETA